MLRPAGPSRAQFRRATEDLVVGGATIPKGGRVLLLAAANRDPERFAEPDRLDFRRGSPRHLAFGDGAHACIGAALVRAAAVRAAILERFAGARLDAPPAWRGGFAIGGPAALWVSAIY